MFRAAKEWKRLENDVTTCEEPCGVRFQIGKKEVKKRLSISDRKSVV